MYRLAGIRQEVNDVNDVFATDDCINRFSTSLTLWGCRLSLYKRSQEWLHIMYMMPNNQATLACVAFVSDAYSAYTIIQWLQSDSGTNAGQVIVS